MLRRASALLLLTLSLTACLADQKRQIARCGVDSARIYPTFDPARTYDRGRYIKQCMGAAGYEFSWVDRACRPTQSYGEDENPFCYRPLGVIGQWALQAEFALSR